MFMLQVLETNAGSTKFEGSDVTYTKAQDFAIEGVTVGRKNITVSDTEYAGGVAVTPNVIIKVGDKTLVEGTDYEFTGLSNNVDVTASNKVLKDYIKDLKIGYKLEQWYRWMDWSIQQSSCKWHYKHIYYWYNMEDC